MQADFPRFGPTPLPASIRWAAVTVCAIYSVGALVLLFGPASGAPVDGTNLVPLHTIGAQLDRGVFRQLIGNALLLAPFAATLRWWGWRFGRLAVVLALVSTAIEAGQALVGRVSDIDDVLLNVSGGLVAAVLAALVAGLLRPKTGRTASSDDGSVTESVGR